jgi:hypothetical protein
MKQDVSWTRVSVSYDPLELYRLIKWVVLKQIEDQYPFAPVYEQSLAVLNTKQGGLSNVQWYEGFNTQHNVAHSVGVELGCKALWEYCAKSKHSMSYDALGTANQAAMHQAANDQYLAYILLVNSGGNTSISGKGFKTTSPRVATSTQRTALRLSYSWTGTQSWPQRTVHCRG